MLSLLNKLEAMLQSSLDSGKLAKLDLAHEKSMLQRAKGLVGLE
jgi:hypothetical protein